MAAPVIECGKCGGAMEAVEDEPMGRLYRCTRCMDEKAVFFDKPPGGLDGIHEAGGRDAA